MSLGDLLRKLGRRWWVIVAVNAVLLVLGFLTAAASDPVYTIELTMLPKTDISQDTFATNPLAKILVNRGGDDKIVQFMYMAKSHTIAELFDRQHGALKKIFGRLWDVDNDSWKQPRGASARIKGMLNSLVGLPSFRAPDSETLKDYLRQEVDIAPVKDTPFWKMRIRHTDPELGVWILTHLFEVTDNYLRDQEKRRLQGQIEYLRERSSQVSEVEYRTFLSTLMLQQEQKLLTIRPDQSFIAALVDPPKADIPPSWPNPVLLVEAVLIGGTVLSSLLLLLYLNWKEGRRCGVA